MNLRHGSLRIVGVYALFSVLWILFSDRVLGFFIEDISVLNTLQTYKGIFFVLVTAALLYGLILSHFRSLQHVQSQLKEQKQRLEYVIQGAGLGYWDRDCVTNVHVVNDTWLSMIGLKRETLKGEVDDWMSLVHPEDKSSIQEAIIQAMSRSASYVVEFRMRHRDGHWVWIESSGAVVKRHENTGTPLRIAGTHKDVSERKKAQEAITFLAHYDPLTKLPNRTLLKLELEKPFYAKGVALLFLDLDQFQRINDLYGHSFGDRLIEAVAARFEALCQDAGFLARMGADEFVMVMSEVDQAYARANAWLESLKTPFMVEGKRVHVRASIGVALFPQDAKSIEELFRNADTALHEAKRLGKNQVVLYTKAMTEQLIHMDTLDKELQEALETDAFVLYYQPQVDLESLETVGAEVLVRWQHPIRGLLSPYAFIPRAEESGFMVPLGWWIVQKALRQLAFWKQAGMFAGTLAINISTVQIEEESFVATMCRLCEEEGIAPSCIELEVTESFVMKNTKESASKLLALKEAGFKLSVDDFGTGYSSLSYLKQLPIDKLKIDRSFVKDTPKSEEDCAIIKAIITLAKNLHLEVLGEGVETQEQALFLKKEGCHVAQGYFYAKPMPPEVFMAV
ncbi:MAG: EAL domain-containing protein [Campylobacterales bacterium]|nr:EAL domain-containing protein [Campylobacterales bacterium]